MSEDSDLEKLEFDEPKDQKDTEANLVIDEVLEPLEVSFEFQDSASIKEKKEETKDEVDSDKLDLSLGKTEELKEDLELSFEIENDETKANEIEKDKADLNSAKNIVSKSNLNIELEAKDDELSFKLDDDQVQKVDNELDEIKESDNTKEQKLEIESDRQSEEVKCDDNNDLGLVEEIIAKNNEFENYIGNQEANVVDNLDEKLKEIEDLKNELSEDFNSKDYFNDLEEKNQQTKEDFLSQYENYEELLESRNKAFPIDIVIYIVLGSIILLMLNYYFFQSTQVPEIKSTPKVEKIKKVANKKKKKKIKKEDLKIEDLNLNGKKEKINFNSDVSLENGLVKKLSMRMKIDAPDPLTDEEIVAGKVSKPWIKKIIFTDISVIQTGTGELFGTGKAKVYFEYLGKKSRVLSDVRISGTVGDKNVIIKSIVTNDINKAFKKNRQIVTIVDDSDKVFFKITEEFNFEL